MRKLAALASLVMLSVLVYLAVFSVVQRPLIVGEVARQLGDRLTYAQTLPSPKVMIFAGSNGRYSHDCAALAAALELPCVNASIGVGIGLDFQLGAWREHLHRGDLVYMPLEYGQYRSSQDDMNGGLQNTLLVHHWRARLWELAPERVLRAWASFDLSFLIQGLAEMGLQAAGVTRRGGDIDHTAQGDARGHDLAAARAYAGFLRSARAEPTTVPLQSHALTVLGQFLDDAHARGVRVIGGLPTMPDTVPVLGADVEALRRFYAAHGQGFVALPNLSRYPMSCFYDTLYHLVQECQQAHSARVGQALQALYR
jgi:hypothetical protein